MRNASAPGTQDGTTATPIVRARRRGALEAAVLLMAPFGLGLGLGTPPVDAAAGGTILSVVTADRAGAARAQRDFDLAALAALPQKTLVATTPWYGATHRFTGPLLRDVLAATGAAVKWQRLTAVALNDYRIEIPGEDVERWPVIVAIHVDGQPVAVRDKGPLMIMYPFDDERSLRTGRYFGRAVWQLRTLELR